MPPLLTAWLPGDGSLLLTSTFASGTLAILGSGGLLYWALRTNLAGQHRAQSPSANPLEPNRPEIEAQIRERTAYLLAINQDLQRQIITRREVETALRDSQERFRQLAEHIREVFWVYDIAEDRLIYVSPAYEEIWGQSINELYAHSGAWLDAVHADDRVRVEAAKNAKRQSGYFDKEYRIIRPDGTTRWIWDRGFPIRDDSNQIYRIAGLAEDITARKLAEDQLRRQQVELARISRLSLAVELAANLAHELNQPLAAIVAYTQACLALLRQANTDPRALTGTLDAIVAQGLRAGEIIRRLRELVQKHPAAQAALDLNALIHSVIRYAQPEFDQARISVQLELPDTLPRVLADDLQIQLVILYLLRNAIEAFEASDKHPGEARKLHVSTALLGADQILATVQDNGAGFQPEMIDQLFIPFFTTKPGGMGLGLTVSRSIIESQGGQLWAKLNPEGGASFYFTLPINAGSSSEARPLCPIPPPSF